MMPYLCKLRVLVRLTINGTEGVLCGLLVRSSAHLVHQLHVRVLLLIVCTHHYSQLCLCGVISMGLFVHWCLCHTFLYTNRGLHQLLGISVAMDVLLIKCTSLSLMKFLSRRSSSYLTEHMDKVASIKFVKYPGCIFLSRVDYRLLILS